MFWGRIFLERVPPESQSFTGVWAWDHVKTPASGVGGSLGTTSFASKELIENQTCFTQSIKRIVTFHHCSCGLNSSDLEKECKIPSDSLTLSDWWSDVTHSKCPVCKSPSRMTLLKFWGTEHFKLFAVLAWLCSIKHYTPQAEGAGMSITQQYTLVTSHQHPSKKTNFSLPASSIRLLPVLTLQEKNLNH